VRRVYAPGEIPGEACSPGATAIEVRDGRDRNPLGCGVESWIALGENGSPVRPVEWPTTRPTSLAEAVVRP